MKTLSTTIECIECGCISFPDATFCPRCGAKYSKKVENNECRDLSELPSYLPIDRFDDFRELIWFSNYQFNCPIHGNIDIRASVISPSVKCPFCR